MLRTDRSKSTWVLMFRVEDHTRYYLVVAATTYLSPKRGLEATCQAQKGALSRVSYSVLQFSGDAIP